MNTAVHANAAYPAHDPRRRSSDTAPVIPAEFSTISRGPYPFEDAASCGYAPGLFPEPAKNDSERKSQHQTLANAKYPAADNAPQACDGAKADGADQAQRLVVENAAPGEHDATEHAPDPHRCRHRRVAVEEVARKRLSSPPDRELGSDQSEHGREEECQQICPSVARQNGRGASNRQRVPVAKRDEYRRESQEGIHCVPPSVAVSGTAF